jgi:predicted alpha-1,2-mannosidase
MNQITFPNQEGVTEVIEKQDWWHPQLRCCLLYLLIFWVSACSSGHTGGRDVLDDGALQDAFFDQVDINDTHLSELSETDDGAVEILADDVDGETSGDGTSVLFRFVDPFIGTGGDLFNVGNALPGATLPFGLVKVSPDTTPGVGSPPGFQHCSGYFYKDQYLYGFSHNHLHGTGAADYGNILVFPVSTMTSDATDRKGHFMPFSKGDEVAEPGYYAVTIENPKVRAELTATERCAYHRYTFLGGTETGSIVFNVASGLLGARSGGGFVQVLNDGLVLQGKNRNIGEFSGRYGGFDVFFVANFSTRPQGYGVFLDDQLRENMAYAEAPENNAGFGAWAQFDLSSSNVVEIKVCLSYCDVDGALTAMETELGDAVFDDVKMRAQEAWEKELSKFEVFGGDETSKRIFYTAVYHALQMPTMWSDVDGSYRGFDGAVHKAQDFVYYTDMSLWDTFRTLHPLLTLVFPERQRAMLKSLEMMQKQGGYVPKWPMGMGDTGSMIGQHGASVVADSFLKGIQDFDVDALYQTLKAQADSPTPAGGYGGRDCFPWFVDPQYGYCPADKVDGSVSKTLEYAFNDYCLSRLADALGFSEDAENFVARSKNYKNLWDAETGFFRPRNEDGSFVSPFSPDGWEDNKAYVEGTAWQYLWFVPHDQQGLMALFGGSEPFVSKLEQFFSLAQENFSFLAPTAWYFHGNEPDLHSPFMFIGASEPEKSAKWASWVLEANYKDTWDGLVGNDDAGTLSAWFVFVASGLYPWVCSTGYYVFPPAFEKVIWHLPDGDLTIEKGGQDEAGLVPFWNGTELEQWWIEHEDLKKGGHLEWKSSNR